MSMLSVGRISEGFVLDHIQAGKSMEIYKYLNLDKLDCTVAIIKNARSEKMGKKDLMKIECPIDYIDLDVLGFIDHNITVNIVKDEKVTEITIELYPELFARRTINIPGVLMGAVYGCSTSDYETYEKSVDMVKADGIKVNIVEGHEPSIQKVTITTDKGNTVFVDSLNRGGGRLVLRDASDLAAAKAAAERLGIVTVEA